ncbi:MAG: hypothetical protein FJ306_01230 [Planctomycetes bacterium]|nr:hypothetical protein [Planctomycetota bacterium]
MPRPSAASASRKERHPSRCRRLACGLAVALWGVVVPSPAQTPALPSPAARTVASPAGEVACAVQLPAAHAAGQWRPLAVFVVGDGDGEALAAAGAAPAQALAAAGFVVAAVPAGDGARGRDGVLLAQLRREFRVEQGGMHAVVAAAAAPALAFVRRNAHEFQTVVRAGATAGVAAAAANATWQELSRLPRRRCVDAGDAPPAAFAERLQRLHGARSLAGAAGDVARALDDFHDAAATGDEDRYFALLPADAVFLGTDGTERWTGAEFRAFALPYFQRPSAWTYVAIARAVDVAPGGEVAWFDEVLDNASYGECRGSGVLVRRDGRWVLRQYNLTIPVPNDLADGVVRRIRAFQGGLPLARTTVVLVRHAEKVDQSTDAALSEAGRERAKELARAIGELPVTAVFTSQFARTKDTVAPLCAGKALTAQAIDAKDTAALAAAVRACAGGTVVVCGHSNSLPQLAAALGVAEPLAFGEREFDALHVVALDPTEGASLLTLRYGR